MFNEKKKNSSEVNKGQTIQECEKKEPQPENLPIKNSENIFEGGKEQYLAALLELIGRSIELGKIFPFPGINHGEYLKMKESDEKFPGYTTPIEEIIERCKKLGIKIVLGKHPESGNVFVLPADSDNIEMDSFSLDKLKVNDVKSEHLKAAILLCQAWINSLKNY